MSRLAALAVFALVQVAFTATAAHAAPGFPMQGGKAAEPRPFTRQWRLPERRGPSQEPASARGYADGYKRGLDDGRDRDRYDPVGHANYRSADAGYSRQYGSRDAYRNNYRSGYRQGYEDGYRDGARGRR